MRRVSPLPPLGGHPAGPDEGQACVFLSWVGVVPGFLLSVALVGLPAALAVFSPAPSAAACLPAGSLFKAVFAGSACSLRHQQGPAACASAAAARRACDAGEARELDLSLGHFRTYGVRHA